MVKQGDRVRVEGREARVTSSWGQGKHTAWALDDGTTVLDLEQKVAAGHAEVLAAEPVIDSRPTRRERQREIERLPRAEHDHEE